MAKRLEKESTELIRQGIGFRSYDPSYFFTNLEEPKLELLEKASVNSKLRAERLAQSAVNKITGIVSASQGIFFKSLNQLPQKLQAGGMYETSSIEKKSGQSSQ